MKITLLIIIIAIVIFIVFYGGYYLINPSQRGEDILNELNITYPTVIAHRGASNIAPELTRPSFENAIKIGADYLEADIHRTRDGKLVIIHDDNLQRTSNIEEVYPERKDDKINTFTYEELLKLDFGSWFNEKHPTEAQDEYEGLKILSLEELLEIVDRTNQKTGIALDIKDTQKYPKIASDIIEVLIKKDWYQRKDTSDDIQYSSRIMIFSFDIDVLKVFKELAPDLPRVLLLDNNRISRRNWRKWLDLAEGKVNGIGVKGFISWPWNIALAHDRNMFVFPYVINKGWQIKIMSHIKSSGYITNRPKLVLDFLDRISEIELVVE